MIQLHGCRRWRTLPGVALRVDLTLPCCGALTLRYAVLQRVRIWTLPVTLPVVRCGAGVAQDPAVQLLYG